MAAPHLTPAQVRDLYDWRDRQLAALARQPVIDVLDLDRTERGLCTHVCNDATLWQRCTDEAKHFLRTHPHHFVRSCAALACPLPRSGSQPERVFLVQK